MNARLRDRGPFRHIWVQPAAGDAGTALGAALWVDARERGRGAASERGRAEGSKPGERSGRLGERSGRFGDESRPYHMDHAYLGPAYSDDEIVRFLRWTQVPYRRLTNVAKEAAELLARGKILGWFQGRMEFGPRALGARSILASPLAPDMQARLSEIKDREDFRPVAPVVLEEEAGKRFAGAGRAGGSEQKRAERPGADVSPFMLFVYDVLPDKADRIPAVRHVDGPVRPEVVSPGTCAWECRLRTRPARHAQQVLTGPCRPITTWPADVLCAAHERQAMLRSNVHACGPHAIL